MASRTPVTYRATRMKNKQQAKNRGKRLAKALGGCRRCGRLAALRSIVPAGPGAVWCECPGCGAELRVTERMLGDGDRLLIRRFARCLTGGEETCPHGFTVTVDGEVRREDPPCGCGLGRAVLELRSAAGR